MEQLTAYLRLLRPGQWIKNGFVVLPLIFAGRFLSMASAIQIVLAVGYFCIASSASYIVNDIHDRHRDRKHPKKQLTRPLATGAVSVAGALILLYFLYAILLSGFFIIPKVMWVIVAYLLLNYAYTYYLKRVPIVDIFVIALGFVLRVYAGAVALQVPLSAWMFITTLSLALFLAATKRLQEINEYASGGATRAVLKVYNREIMRKFADAAALCAIVFYSIFVLIANQLLIATIPLVMFGVFRYWYIVEMGGKGESPSKALYSDWPLIIVIAVWLAVVIYILS